MKKYEILILDDDESLCRLLKDRIELDVRFAVFTANFAKKGLQVIQQNNISIVFLDVQLPDESGIDTLKKIKENDPEITIIMITAHGSINLAVESMQLGASHFLTKPFPFEQSIQLIERFIEKQQLIREHRLLKQEMQAFKFEGGKSPATKHLLQLVEQAAPTNSTILIGGPSGTGKELIARLIYKNSNRSDKPFTKIDCTMLSSNILESDLFGHEKGAFTGASQLKRGRLELADNGTVFFDEIGELPIELQAKLLRIIQYGEFERVGGVKALKTNIRVIAATNRNIEQLVKDGKFREDLFYRLNVINIKMPTLKERIYDIPELISFFIKKYNSDLKRNIVGVTFEVEQCFKKYSWPGNVRELENMIERAIVFSENDTLDIKLFPETIQLLKETEDSFEPETYKKAMANFKRKFILEQLKKFNGDVTKISRQIELPRTYLYQLFKELNINLKQFKSML